MNIEDWKIQIRRGVLEYCILIMLQKKTFYGYELLQNLQKYPIISIKESTVYPLLRRLLKEDYLSAKWDNSIEGVPPRKYYTLTPNGEYYLKELSFEWDNLLKAVNLLKGE